MESVGGRPRSAPLFSSGLILEAKVEGSIPCRLLRMVGKELTRPSADGWEEEVALRATDSEAAGPEAKSFPRNQRNNDPREGVGRLDGEPLLRFRRWS